MKKLIFLLCMVELVAIAQPGSGIISITSPGGGIVPGQLITTNQLTGDITIFTNFPSGLMLSNSYGVEIQVKTAVAVTGGSGAGTIDLEVRGGTTNFASIPALGGGSFVLTLIGRVPTNSLYTFTNYSTGSGAASVVANSGEITIPGNKASPNLDAATLGGIPSYGFLQTNTPAVLVTDNETNLSLNISVPLIAPTNIQATGFTLGGVSKTNWSMTTLPFSLVNLGAGTVIDLSTSNSIVFFKPSLDPAADKSTNFANYVSYVPSDCDSSVAPNLIVVMSRSGANGDCVLSFKFVQGTPFPGTLSSEILSTNTYTGTGGRSVVIVKPSIAWSLTPGLQMVIQVARDGPDTADTLSVAAQIQSVSLEYLRR